MNINKTSRQNFGWSCKTHYLLTRNIAESIPQLRKYAFTLAISSATPDIKLSQTSLGYNMAHYFDGKNFVEYDMIPNNASDFYFDNLTKALHYFDDGIPIIGMIKAGNALHFLQDVAVPMHTNPDCFSVIKTLQHIQYERRAKKFLINNEELITQNLTDTTKSFKDCFMDTYNKSSQMENPFSISSKNRNASIQESLSNACENTYNFLKQLAKIQNTPPSEIKNSVWTEIAKFFINK